MKSIKAQDVAVFASKPTPDVCMQMKVTVFNINSKTFTIPDLRKHLQRCSLEYEPAAIANWSITSTNHID
jgi:hypothetical protein